MICWSHPHGGTIACRCGRARGDYPRAAVYGVVGRGHRWRWAAAEASLAEPPRLGSCGTELGALEAARVAVADLAGDVDTVVLGPWALFAQGAWRDHGRAGSTSAAPRKEPV